MKTLGIFALGFCLVLLCYGRSPQDTPLPRLPLSKLPELNSILQNLPEPRGGDLVNSGTIAHSYEVIVDEIPWRVAVQMKSPGLGRVIMLKTLSPRFTSADGATTQTLVSDLKAKYPSSLYHEQGWGSWIELPSGISAFLCVEESKLTPESRVEFFFSRCR